MLDDSWQKLCLTTLALIVLALASICTFNSTRWIDSAFP